MSEHIHTNNRNLKLNTTNKQATTTHKMNYNNSAALDLRYEHTLAMTDKQYNKKTF